MGLVGRPDCPSLPEAFLPFLSRLSGSRSREVSQEEGPGHGCLLTCVFGAYRMREMKSSATRRAACRSFSLAFRPGPQEGDFSKDQEPFLAHMPFFLRKFQGVPRIAGNFKSKWARR